MNHARIHLYRDGDAWCAVWDSFENLAESIAGHGADPNEAVRDLISQTDFHELQRISLEWQIPINSLEQDPIGTRP